VLVLIGLAALVLLSFSGVFQNGFVHYDDHVYVTDNPHVRGGLSWEGVRWALTATEAGFWHPLTWLSLMADAQAFRLNPAGYHGTSLLLHLLTTGLLFFVLSGLTGSVWRSAFAAALFGVHPLQVEAVAWVAARKDVLSAFFWVLSLGVYGWYALRPGLLRYVSLLAVFALGLASKPMVATLPLVLLLLDVWPLRRPVRGDGTRLLGGVTRFRPAAVGRLLLEKVPLAVMAALAVAVTVLAEGKAGALKSLESFTVFQRVANAVVSYVRYLGKVLWPADLSIHYGHPGDWPVWAVAGSALLLAVISVAVLSRFRKAPYLGVGWLWFLVTLLPVIGLVQIGIHSMADRYAYLPSIGLFLMASWGLADLSRGWLPSRPAAAAAVAFAVLAVLAVVTWNQVSHWRSAVTVFRHAARVEPANALVLNNLGAALTRAGKAGEAAGPLRRALAIRPGYPEAAFNLGAALAETGDVEGAVSWYDRALALHPRFAEAYNNKGVLLARSGRAGEAATMFRKALAIRPDYEEARRNLARAILEAGP
jgi:Flp pilus assembly protein TadD